MKGSGRPSDQLLHHLKIMRKRKRSSVKGLSVIRNLEITICPDIWSLREKYEIIHIKMCILRPFASTFLRMPMRKIRRRGFWRPSPGLMPSRVLLPNWPKLGNSSRFYGGENRIGSPHQSMSIEINPLAIPWKTKPPTDPAEIQHFITRRSDHRVGHMNMIKYDYRVISKCS